MATCSLHEMKNRLGMPCPICTNITLRAELEKAETALAAVAALHDEYDGPHTYCHDCGGLTPCATRRALRDAKWETNG